MSHSLACRLGSAALACALALTGAASEASAAPGCRVARGPAGSAIGGLVRHFYAWYLGELRAGRRPAADPKLHVFVSDAYLNELRGSPVRGFDPVLSLPEPASAWASMIVTQRTIEVCHRPGLRQAYVYVTYSRYRDPQAHTVKGTRFMSISSAWAIGLDRTPAGWRIASIGLEE